MVAPNAPRTARLAVPQLLSALDRLPAMVAYWDSDLRNHIANSAYLEWFGVAPSEMRGMHIRDLLGPEFYESNLPYIRGALSGEAQLFDRVLIDAFGRTRHTQASYIPDIVAGVVKGFVVLVTDITERVHAEAALQASVANLALLQERQRIAADLHDLVIQSLYAANLELSALGRAVDPETALRAEQVIGRIDDAVRTLRAAIAGLTRTIEPDQFLADVAHVVDNATGMLGFAPTFTIEGAAELVPPEARSELLAVLQEALSNAARHAHATSVSVTVTTVGPRTRLLVIDNGVGIGCSGRSSGLTNMRARAERLGGSFRCSDNDPHGTIIDWRVPATPREPAVELPRTAPSG